MTTVFKRIFDVLLALVSLVLFAPVMLIIYVLIKKEDPDGDAIYAQERIGLNGKPFKLYKFRSMHMDAEALNTPQLYAGEDDPRLTEVGKFIRAHHLDEFPQLWNVLKGDMSFVGPRPERQYYTDTMEKMLKRLDYDLQYLEDYSFWTDIKIIYLTSISIIFGKKF